MNNTRAAYCREAGSKAWCRNKLYHAENGNNSTNQNYEQLLCTTGSCAIDCPTTCCAFFRVQDFPPQKAP